MELKVGREYLDAFHNFKYKVLGTRNDRVYVVDDGELHDLSFSSCKSDELLPPSIEYLKGINQPFGTLDEDVQKALINLDLEIYTYAHGWVKRWNVIDNEATYRLSSDYVEKPAYVPKSFKETKVRVYNGELNSKVNEALEKLGYEANLLYTNVQYLFIDKRNNVTWGDKEDYFLGRPHKEVQAHEILEEAGKL